MFQSFICAVLVGPKGLVLLAVPRTLKSWHRRWVYLGVQEGVVKTCCLLCLVEVGVPEASGTDVFAGGHYFFEVVELPFIQRVVLGVHGCWSDALEFDVVVVKVLDDPDASLDHWYVSRDL